MEQLDATREKRSRLEQEQRELLEEEVRLVEELGRGGSLPRGGASSGVLEAAADLSTPIDDNEKSGSEAKRGRGRPRRSDGKRALENGGGSVPKRGRGRPLQV